MRARDVQNAQIRQGSRMEMGGQGGANRFPECLVSYISSPSPHSPPSSPASPSSPLPLAALYPPCPSPPSPLSSPSAPRFPLFPRYWGVGDVGLGDPRRGHRCASNAKHGSGGLGTSSNISADTSRCNIFLNYLPLPTHLDMSDFWPTHHHRHHMIKSTSSCRFGDFLTNRPSSVG